ncbi:MAG: hypothetical protein JW800_00875 [Candidatus Omnitrophica bacterium]|nr:hypothetical protein [Candidatus Omnitrophota bacterium]
MSTAKRQIVIYLITAVWIFLLPAEKGYALVSLKGREVTYGESEKVDQIQDTGLQRGESSKKDNGGATEIEKIREEKMRIMERARREEPVVKKRPFETDSYSYKEQPKRQTSYNIDKDFTKQHNKIIVLSLMILILFALIVFLHKISSGK